MPPILLEDEFNSSVTARTSADHFSRLSPRQQQVVKLLLQGQSNKVIARELGLSEETVKAHTEG